MGTLLGNIKKYNFSFTGSGLRINQFDLVLKHFSKGEPLDVTQEIGSGKTSTGERIFRDLKKRYNTLTPKEVDLFLSGDMVTRKHIAFLSICKTYAFIRDLTIEVLREKFLVFDYQVTEGDIVSFMRRKSEIHEELQERSDKTLYMARQTTFKILEDAGIIDAVDSKIIQPQLLEEQVARAIAEDDPQWLMIFMMSDQDIKKYIQP